MARYIRACISLSYLIVNSPTNDTKPSYQSLMAKVCEDKIIKSMSRYKKAIVGLFRNSIVDKHTQK